MAGVTPIDYASPLTTAPQVNPAQAVAQGMQVGNGLIDAQRQTTLFNQAQQDRQRAIDAATQQAIAAAKAQAQMRADLDAAAADGSVESNLALMAKYPQLAEGLKKRHDALSEQRKADAIRQNVTMSAAISNGEPLVAADYARRDAAAIEKTDPAAAESLRRMADLIDAHPEKANVLLQSYVMANGGREAVEALQKAQQGQAAQQKAEADALKAETEAKVAAATALDQALGKIDLDKAQAARFKAQSFNEAARLGLDREKFAFEKAQSILKAQQGTVDLDTDVKKAIEADAGAATAARSFVRDASNLAADMRKGAPMGGLAGGVRDALTGALGADTTASDLNQRYIDARNGLIRSARKPGEGPMSDADFKAAAAGLPGELASPEAKARTLERLALKAEVSGKLFSAAARFRALTGGPGGGRITVNVDGVDIPPKTDLATFNAMMTDHYLAQQEAAAKTSTDKDVNDLGIKLVP